MSRQSGLLAQRGCLVPSKRSDRDLPAGVLGEVDDLGQSGEGRGQRACFFAYEQKSAIAKPYGAPARYPLPPVSLSQDMRHACCRTLQRDDLGVLLAVGSYQGSESEKHLSYCCRAFNVNGNYLHLICVRRSRNEGRFGMPANDRPRGG